MQAPTYIKEAKYVKGLKQAYIFNYDTYNQNSNNTYTATGKFDVDLTYADERGKAQSLNHKDRTGNSQNPNTIEAVLGFLFAFSNS